MAGSNCWAMEYLGRPGWLVLSQASGRNYILKELSALELAVSAKKFKSLVHANY